MVPEVEPARAALVAGSCKCGESLAALRFGGMVDEEKKPVKKIKREVKDQLGTKVGVEWMGERMLKRQLSSVETFKPT